MFLDARFPLLLLAFLSIFCDETSQDDYNWAPASSSMAPCGQYGFRCVDSKRFQICPYRDSEGTTEEPDGYHECKEGFICDEDNPAYCTPQDPLLTTQISPEAEEAEEDIDFYDPQRFDENYNADYVNEVEPPMVDQYRDVRSAENEAHGHHENCECQTTTTTEESSTSTTTETTDFTTMGFTPMPPFDCDNYGFFQDLDNKTLFWYCDVDPKGTGFYLRHMKCGTGRVFDQYKHACVLEDTVREVREYNEDPENDDELEDDISKKFSCSGKTPGKYADDKNCQLYHVCLTKPFEPFQELLFSCPDETAFDPSSQRCSRRATYRCLNKDGTMEKVIHKENPKIHCKSPSRFREISDCSGYYLCYGDQLLEMMCPEFYKFDDNIMECLPEGIARCDEVIE